MDETITIAGIEIPKVDWESTPASVKALVMMLSERLSHIEEQLGKNSKNSSLPPSKDKYSQSQSKLEESSSQKDSKSKDSQKSSKKQGNRQSGKGFGFYPVEEKHRHHHIPKTCSHCGKELKGVDKEPQRHQIVDVPPLTLQVEEHQLHQLTCECCGKKTRGRLPPEVPTTGYGDRLVALVGLLSSGEYRQSHSMAQSLIRVLFGLKLSRSSINRMRMQVSRAIAEPVDRAHEYLQNQKSVHSDETGFPQRNRDGANAQERQGWLWVLCGALVSVFRVSLHRSRKTAKELIGERFGGIVHSDRYGAYNWLPVEQRQICWAHLKRDLTQIAERHGVSQEIGNALLARQRRLFRWWHRVRDGTMTREQLVKAVEHLRRGFKAELEAACALDIGVKEKSALAKSVRTLREIRKVEGALWTFVYQPDIEPTNNLAERALRSGVIWRRTTQGSQSKEGSEFAGRILTVTTSLKVQERDAWDFLSEALRAQRLGVAPPSLLPFPKPQDLVLPLGLLPPSTSMT